MGRRDPRADKASIISPIKARGSTSGKVENRSARIVIAIFFPTPIRSILIWKGRGKSREIPPEWKFFLFQK